MAAGTRPTVHIAFLARKILPHRESMRTPRLPSLVPALDCAGAALADLMRLRIDLRGEEQRDAEQSDGI
jgi:hypothetical protein